MPVRSAAAMTSSPGLASMPRPSMVTVTVVLAGASAGSCQTWSDLARDVDAVDGTAVVDVGLELVAEAA